MTTIHSVDEADAVRYDPLVNRIEAGPVVKVQTNYPAEKKDYKFPVGPSWAQYDKEGNGTNYQFNCLRIDDTDTYVLIYMYNGTCSIHAYADTHFIAVKAIRWVEEAIPKKKVEEEDVGIYFWTMSKMGPQSTWREISAPTWDVISRNYTEDTREKLAQLFSQDLTDDRSGHLVLWTGPPGTGKTYAIRSWMQALKDKKATFHYIVDPDAFFADASYMMQVCMNGDTGEGTVLILEDAGALIAADAREQTGQGLSRMLNLSDGLVGQGLKLHILITTNEELGDLNEAAIREGRCRSKINFREFSAAEAGEWMGEDHESKKWTLADMYAKVEHRKRDKDALKSIGFVT